MVIQAKSMMVPQRDAPIRLREEKKIMVLGDNRSGNASDQCSGSMLENALLALLLPLRRGRRPLFVFCTGTRILLHDRTLSVLSCPRRARTVVKQLADVLFAITVSLNPYDETMG